MKAQMKPKMNQRLGMAVGIMAAAIVWSQAGFAQGPQRRRGPSPEQAIQRLAERLNLTDDQKSTIESYFADQRSQLEVLRNDSTLTREQKQQRRREITQQTREKIRSVLTVEQQQQAEQLRSEARQRRQERAEERFDATARLLELTPDQKTQMQSFLENQRAQMQALRSDSSLTPEQRREQAQAIRQQTRSNIGSLLTPEQQQKMQDLQITRRGERRRGRRGGRRGPGRNPGA